MLTCQLPRSCLDCVAIDAGAETESVPQMEAAIVLVPTEHQQCRFLIERRGVDRHRPDAINRQGHAVPLWGLDEPAIGAGNPADYGACGN